MAIYCNAAGEGFYWGSASIPDLSYWAVSLWLHHSAVPSSFGSLGGIQRTDGTNAHLILSDATPTQLALYDTLGASSNIVALTVGTWYHVYALNSNGSGSGGCRAAGSGTYSTATCTNFTVSAGTHYFGCGVQAYGAGWTLDSRIAHYKVWSGSTGLPTVAQLQQEGLSARPILPVTWAWLPCWDASTYTSDRSGLGRNATANSGSPTTADGPPVGWGAAPLFVPSISQIWQYGRPISDVAKGSWTASTGSDLYAMIDEEGVSDADYIRSP